MLNALFASKARRIDPARALPGRPDPIPTAKTHFLSHRPLELTVPAGMEAAEFAMGCFWGVERLFWNLPGVHLTMAGYAGGHTPNPTYREVCSGETGHAEAVHLIHDPKVIPYAALLRIFWENHDPTQGMRQGNDLGTQYRSAIHTFSDAQASAAEASRHDYAARLAAAGLGAVTTEIAPAGPFYMAEAEHQQYLAQNPGGYCGIAGTGVSCPIGIAV